MDGRHDFIAVDTEFRRFVRETYHRGRRVSDATMLRRYAKWGRWKYLAYWSELWSEAGVELVAASRGGDGQVVYAARAQFGILTAGPPVWIIHSAHVKVSC